MSVARKLFTNALPAHALIAILSVSPYAAYGHDDFEYHNSDVADDHALNLDELTEFSDTYARDNPPLNIDTSKAPPVYVQVDDKGRPFNLELSHDKKNGYSLVKRYLTGNELAEMRATFKGRGSKAPTPAMKKLLEIFDEGPDVVLVDESTPPSPFPEVGLENLQNGAGADERLIDTASVKSSYRAMDENDPASTQINAATSSTCPIPSSFIMSATSSSKEGSVKEPTSSRPPGTNTQWIVMDFFSTDLRASGSHVPVVSFWKPTLHGWGTFFGDNGLSQVACPNGYPGSRYTTQIEGWYQLAGDDENWQSQTFNGSNSCGVEMYDGPVSVAWFSQPKYRLEMHANTDHWVAYRIWVNQNPMVASWSVLADWVALDVEESGSWTSPYTLDTTAEGIFIGPTETSLPSDGGHPMSVTVTNADCGWF